MTAAVTPLTQWAQAIDNLVASIRRLDEAVTQRSVALVQVRREDAQARFREAESAARAVGNANLAVPAELQQQWITVLTVMEGVMKRAQDVRELVQVMGEPSGLTIPGTRIVVPWAAVLGIAAVAALGFYFTRGRR